MWAWDASQHLALSETTATQLVSPPQYPISINGTPAADLYHCNSIDLDPSAANPSDADLLVSMRHTSAVYRISRSGTILWKLTGMGNTAVGTDAEPVLTPSDSFSGQHDARFRPNGDITIFDDDTWLWGTARGVEYSINIGAKTATDVWQYAPVGGNTAGATGSFRRSDDGSDNVIGWGSRTPSGFTEVDASGNVLLDVNFPHNEKTYRVLKFPKTDALMAVLRATAGGSAPPAVSWPQSFASNSGPTAGAQAQTATGVPSPTAPGVVSQTAPGIPAAAGSNSASGSSAGGLFLAAPDPASPGRVVVASPSSSCSSWDASLAVSCRKLTGP